MGNLRLLLQLDLISQLPWFILISVHGALLGLLLLFCIVEALLVIFKLLEQPHLLVFQFVQLILKLLALPLLVIEHAFEFSELGITLTHGVLKMI